MNKGLFIALEGGEGAGKSTQAGLLEAMLHSLDLAVMRTREPGGSPGAEQIRRLLVEGEADRWDWITEALLFNAARHDHFTKTILPGLERGEVVVCDRFSDSTRAYQGYGYGHDIDIINRLQVISIGTFRPDLTLVFDIPVEVGLARAASRGGKEARFESMQIDFHHRMREGYLSMAGSEPERYQIIDADRPAEEIHKEVLEIVWAKIKK